MQPADYARLQRVKEQGEELDRELADKVADAMKEWAMNKGATHYTHWFQPLNGLTAEKHEAFISIDKEGNTILEFSGKSLSKGEADASSFPSGGIRNTFEARGYTVWDVTSPAFIKKSQGGTGVLCIPTVFCSYGGQALDKKTPLLRSMEFLNKQAKRVLELLGAPAEKVFPNVGAEQEYFLIDKETYKKRDDLRFTGRTLFGAPAPKGQEKSDQYYAKIRERVLDYMADLNEELWKLGITAKTQHNEAAPSQHELAPIFNTANIASDQNQIIMETMKKVADRHGLSCLLHEKPFQGISGSGKHNNWSLCTSDGRNLLDIGKTPKENKIFLVFFLAVIAGVDEYQDLLRMSCGSFGNDLRLGGHEAPPGIISIAVGERFAHMFEAESPLEIKSNVKEYIKMGINWVPKVRRDDSDRNRTSPLAFTGNKFEFRLVGSMQTLATPNTVLNMVTGEMLRKIADEIEAHGKEDLDNFVAALITRLIKEHKKIVFDGNNYSQEWREEAKRRGLMNFESCVESFDALERKEVKDLYISSGVLTEEEMHARREIYLNDYANTVKIEAQTMLSIYRSQIEPAVMRYHGELAKAAAALSELGLGKVQKSKAAEIENLLTAADNIARALDGETKNAQRISEAKAKAVAFRDRVVPLMLRLREKADAMQLICDKSVWPFPTYSDILFYE